MKKLLIPLFSFMLAVSAMAGNSPTRFILETDMGNDIEDAMALQMSLRDIPSAKYILEQWPTPVDIIPYKIGSQVHFPIATIDNGFPWQPKNIIVDAFNAYRKYRNQDSPMWDTPSVVLAVEGDKWYTMSPATWAK